MATELTRHTWAQPGSNSNNLSTVKFTLPVGDATSLFTRIRLRLDSSWDIKETATADANRMVYDIPVILYGNIIYTFNVEVPNDKEATITYDGNSIVDGGEIYGTPDINLFVATDIAGYTWSVVIDEENETVTLRYTEAPVTENPASVVALINRVGGEGTDAKFKFVLDPSINSRQEAFVIGAEEGKVLIKGTTISAITTGIGWYLQNYAKINIAWNSLNEKTVSGAAYADLSGITPPTTTETRTCDAVYRYYLNTCTFGYSMTSWTWKRWQQEIDWMALHGINMPLQLVGLEEVWRTFLTMEDANGNRKYGYDDAAAKAFVAGPAFIAWWAMNNLEGWGGTAAGTKSGGTWDGAGGVQDDAWYARQKKLAKQITDRQRELGMQPVIPGWSGMVPTNFASKSNYATRANGGNWAGDFVRPLLLSVNVGKEKYAEIAADYYACLHAVMGESQYYSMDPFHEGGGDGTMEDYEALYAAMEAAKPGSQWVIQQWQWSATQKYSLTAVPAGRLIVLDLFSDGSPAFDGYSGYAPQDAVFCAIPNFGGRSGLMGRLNNVTDNYFKFKAKYASIKGIGTAPEAIEQTPVAYDLIYQLPWMGSKPSVAEWVKNYAIARYGADNAVAQEAWELLRQGPLNYGADGIQGPVEDVWAARPNLNANQASYWGKTLTNAMSTYTKARQQMLVDATYKLLAQSDALGFAEGDGSPFESNYKYDIVEFGGAVLADYAYYLLLGVRDAKNAGGTSDATYIARRDAFLNLILDVDRFKGTNLNFRLGKWTQEARAAAAEVEGAQTATADWYEYNNARTIVSTWSSPNTNLNDYSYRSWQGLMKDLYYKRWEYYFNNNCTDTEYGYFEWNWAHGKTHSLPSSSVSSTALQAGEQGHTDSYTREPEGNTVAIATEVLGKYIIPVKKSDDTYYYAYRCFTTDLTANCTVSAKAGGTVDLSKYFGELAGATATITGEFIGDNATDIKNVPVKSGVIPEGAVSASSTATITLSDATVLTFTLVAESAEVAAAKEELATLIERMEALTAQVGTFNSAVATEIGMTTTEGEPYYIFCNNPHTEGNDAAGGVAALLDEDAATYLHSNWDSKSSEWDYLQVNFGSATGLTRFKIAGQQRDGGQNDRPKTIEVKGSADGTTWVDIASVTDLPNSVGATWESGEIKSATAYPYLRFVVKTHDNYQKTNGGDRPYFHMAKFDLFKLTTTAQVNEGFDPELTNEYAAERYDVLLDAKIVYNTSLDQQTIEAATEALQTAYDELNALVNGNFPFTFTTDEENPVLYKIIVKRADDGSKVLHYDESSKMVAVENRATNSSYQAWYFMRSANGFTIHPYNGDGKVLGADNTGNGYAKVWAVEKGDKAFYEWKIVVNEANKGYYNIQVYDESNYFSNNGGTAYKMGFWNSANDNGGLFKFEEATFDNNNPRYYQLKDYDASAIIAKGGTNPGYYDVTTFSEKYATVAQPLIDAGNTANAAECYAAYQAMREAETTVQMIMPEAGAVYRIKNIITKASNEAHRVHYIDVNKTFPISAADDDKTILWTCVKDGDKYKFVSVSDPTKALGFKNVVATESAQAFVIGSGVELGAVSLGNGSNVNLALTNEMFKNNEGNATVDFNQAGSNGKIQDATWSTDWCFEFVNPYPFDLTTDEENPVLYNINFKRGADAFLKFLEDGKQVKLARENIANASYYAFYFMRSANGFTIHPYNGYGKVLGASNIDNGEDKIKAVEPGTEGYVYEWTLLEQADGYYNIKITKGGQSNYMSDFGNRNLNTGFYSYSNDSDEGSLFKFFEATFEPNNPRYYQLSDVKAALPDAANIHSGTSVGLYTGVAEYRTAYETAATLVTAGNTSDAAECYAAYTALREAKENMSYNAADPTKVYYIVSASTKDYCAGEYVHTHTEPITLNTWAWGDRTYDHDDLRFSPKVDIEPMSLAAFQFEATATQGEYKMKNLHTGLYVKTFNGTHMGATDATIKVEGYADGQVTLKIGNNSPMHAQNDYSVIVQWDAEPGGASLWTINEVTDLAELNYNVTVPESGFTTLNLAFNVVLPQGVTAYDVTASNIAQKGSKYVYTLSEVATAGDVLAAGTPVIIKAAAGSYEFAVNLSNDGVKGATDGSVLEGTYWQQAITPAEGAHYYTLATDGDGNPVFNYCTAETTIPANTCWLQLDEKQGDVICEVIELAAGSVYRIKNVVGEATKYIVNRNVSLALANELPTDNSDLWVCLEGENGGYKFVSALGTATFGWTVASEEPQEYTIVGGTAGATFSLKKEGEGYLAINGNAFGSATEKSNATDWSFELVEDATVGFATKIKKNYKWSTMYLPYAVNIPDDVEAYYATTESIVKDNETNKKVIVLNKIEETVIPKNTAVLLYRVDDAPTAVLNLNFELAEDVDALDSDNLFKGNIMRKEIDSAAEKVYFLLKNNGKEAFYWVTSNSGSVTSEANKAYFTQSALQGSASYSFRFDWGGTTDIEGIWGDAADDDAAIYDLQGRRVLNTVKGGIYIKNGEKFIAR